MVDRKKPSRSPRSLRLPKALPAAGVGKLSTNTFLQDLWPSLWGSFTDGISIHDTKGRYLFVSPSYLRIVGYSEEELIGQVFTDFVPQELRAEYAQMYERAIAGGMHGVSGDFQLVHKDGRLVHINSRYSIVRTGRRTLHVFISRDVTEQRALEKQLLQSDRMRALGTLAGGVAHEFNNLLVSILGYAEMIEELRPLEEKPVREFARKIQRAALRGTQLTGQLLPFASKEEMLKRPVNLHHILLEVVELSRTSLGRQIQVQTELTVPRPWVLGSRIQLLQVFLNLLLNARDAMPGGGNVFLSTRTVPDPDQAQSQNGQPHTHILAEVQDTGQGMAEEVQRRVFEPFFTTKDPGASHGLGLAMVYSAVSNHGGKVVVSSQPGQGSRFQVYLPALEESVPG